MAAPDPQKARHERVKQIFMDAHEVPRRRRAAVVAAACNGDEALNREVLELLMVDGESDHVLDEPLNGSEALAEVAVNGETTIGPYRILEEIGRGGMGIVHLAERDGGMVALKVLSVLALLPELRARFELEARILQRLDHPGIARILDVGEDTSSLGIERPWIAMELVVGKRLLDYAREEDLTAEAKLELVAKVCDAEQHAHERDVVHRDLKPSNILVRADGQPVVLDFGVARLLVGDERPTEQHTRTGQLLGTPQYMSPEQVQADPTGVGPPGDVYSLGVILYELLTGRPPYEASSLSLHRALAQILTSEPEPLGRVIPALRGPTERIVHHALEKDPGLRYPDAGALADDLRRRLDGRSIRARGPSLSRRIMRWSRRQKRLAAAVSGVFLLAALAGAVAIGRSMDVPKARILATYREAETLVSQASSILYQRERTVDGMRQVIDMLTRARAMIGEVPPLRHHDILLRGLEKDLGTAYMLLGEMTWDAGYTRLAVVTIEHALLVPLDLDSSHLRDRQVPYLGDFVVPPADLYGLLAGSHVITHRLWGEPENLESAMRLAHQALDANRGVSLDPTVTAEARGARAQHIGYDYNALAAVGTEIAIFRGTPEAALAATSWSDSAWERRDSFRHEWPAYGSLLFERGRAFLALGEVTGSMAALDTAAVYLRACIDYRGPERPQTHSETREVMARLALARARLAPEASRPALLRTCLAELQASHVALTRTVAAPAHLAWLRAQQAAPFVELALATGDLAPLDSAQARLDETRAQFPPTTLPRHAAFHWLGLASVQRARHHLAQVPGALFLASQDLSKAEALARARRDTLVLALVERERRAQQAEQPLP